MKCFNRDCKYNNLKDINNCIKTEIILDREGKCLDFCPLDYIELNYQSKAINSINKDILLCLGEETYQ